MSPTLAQPGELSWSGNAAPPYPTKLTSTQQQHSDDSSCASSDVSEGGSDVCSDVADGVARAGASWYNEEVASLNAAAAPWTPPTAATKAHAMTMPDTTHNTAAAAYSSSDARSDLADDVVSDVAVSVPGQWDSTEMLQMYVDAQQQLQRIRAVPRHQLTGQRFDPNSVRSVIHKLKTWIHHQHAGGTLLQTTKRRALIYLQQGLMQCCKRFDHCGDDHVLCQWSTLVASNAKLAYTLLQQVCTIQLQRSYKL
jgi:hypothetical protein